jgi:hypothetical protein
MWTIPKETPELEEFTAEEITGFIQTLAQAVVKRGMSVPTLIALEMVKPLSFIGSQAFIVLAPALEIVFDGAKLEKLNSVLGNRDRVERLMKAIEELEIKEGDSKHESR